MASAKDDRAGQLWVLDTETKGTGANMVPLERVLRRGSDAVPGFTLPERLRPADEAEASKQPYRFKIIDVMTRRVLAEDVDARAALEVLAGVRSLVDVTIHVWHPAAEEWVRLTFGEAKALWELRDQVEARASAPAQGSDY